MKRDKNNAGFSDDGTNCHVSPELCSAESGFPRIWTPRVLTRHDIHTSTPFTIRRADDKYLWLANDISPLLSVRSSAQNLEKLFASLLLYLLSYYS
jgi:hypothetical protein